MALMTPLRRLLGRKPVEIDVSGTQAARLAHSANQSPNHAANQSANRNSSAAFLPSGAGSDPVEPETTQLLRRLVERPHRTLHSFYGRTAGLGGLNDALPLWDRYIGHERTAEPRLRDARDGYLFQVITKGQGTMPAYAHQVEVEDRWRIVHYLRVLQSRFE